MHVVPTSPFHHDLPVDAAHLQPLHFKTGWVEGLYKELEFSGEVIISHYLLSGGGHTVFMSQLTVEI